MMHCCQEEELVSFVELMQPSITGTKNVLNACLKAKVKKVVTLSELGTCFTEGEVEAILSSETWLELPALGGETLIDSVESCRKVGILN
ncbi:hypothetical protein LWI29_020817 [Acer saccharum]|uniref:3-beta hydroxysteroid dehydrogenase/isomerase domain-containing protein n=1 Tax=Acer saccharum TaxID=4024 RepID=A0AA39VEE6_ACESA|nr:hypothetical protein LWI29_020817 [Acer saccharum]